jgi:16S rRNA (cytosine967-C5)-methyltransferase
MKIPFQEYHLFELLESYSSQSLPLDVCMNIYFRSNKALGSKDRAFIAETAFKMIRWLRLIDHLSPKCPSWQERYHSLISDAFPLAQKDSKLAPAIRLSCSDFLFSQLSASHGLEKACKICEDNNSPAPTTVRVNSLKTTREQLLEKWNEKYSVIPTKHSPHGIQFLKKINFFGLDEYKEGLFEVQDEGSQLIAETMKLKTGQHVLDYCAGSGGKTLAFAPQLQGSGQIYVHDIRPRVLIEAKNRLKRAGIQNVQILKPGAKKSKALKKRMDWVLVDAPCSGTGTFRRNPSMKWRFCESMLKEILGLQRHIFEIALSYLKPGGRIVYATCSVLNQENQEQVEHFCKTYGLVVEGTPFISLPEAGEMDGFFAATLRAEAQE